MKKTGVLLLALFFWLPLRSQSLNDGGNIDQSPYNFGFSLALNYGRFQVFKKEDFQADFGYTDVNGTTEYPGELVAIQSIGRPGFGLGLLANGKLNRHFDLRFTPNINFADRDIRYIYASDPAEDPSPEEPAPPGNEIDYSNAEDTYRLNTRSTSFQFPLLLKYKSARQGNIRVYLIGGAKYCLEVTSGKKYREAREQAADFPADPENPLFVDRGYFAWEAGLGLDLYYPFFKCSPELKLSRSFKSVLIQDHNRYSHPLDGLFAELIQFTVHFE